MMNIHEIEYPFYSYIPSRCNAIISASLIFVLLFSWVFQSIRAKCRPISLSLFIFISHLTLIIDLILRVALSINVLKTNVLYRVTAPLLSTPPRLLLMANYRCLVELQEEKPRSLVNRMIKIIVPIGAGLADIFLTIANELSLTLNHIDLSFSFRQISVTFILVLSILFYVIWYLIIPYERRFYILPLLLVSSIAVLIETICVLTNSIPSSFHILNQNEYWYYSGHVIPIVLALFCWTLFHPSRWLLPSKINIIEIKSDNTCVFTVQS